MPFGPFVNKNHFAAYVSLSAVLALGLGWGLARQAAGSGDAKTSAAPPGSAVLAYGMAMAMLISVLLSLSRAGALGIAAGASTFLIAATLARRRRRSLRWPVAAGLAVATVIVLSQLPTHVYGRLGTLMRWRQESSASYRLSLWQDSLRTWRKSPWLGYGFAAYSDALPPQKTTAEIYRVEHAENDGLELAVEGGAAGVMMVALCVALPVAAIARRLKSCDRVTRGIVCGALGAATGFLVHGLFDFPFHIPAAVLSLAVVVALAGAAGGACDHSGWRPIAIAVGVLIGAATSLLFAGGAPDPRGTRTLALRAAGSGDADGRRLRLAMAEASVRRDIGRRPADPESWLIMSWLRHAAGERQAARSLAAHALSMDPLRPELQDAVSPFSTDGAR
jgi:O-antigen ligase